jgi:signal transduction histidine kinase
VTAGVGILIGLTVWGQYTARTTTTLLVLDTVIGVVSFGLVPAYLRWPVPATLALTVLAAVSPAATPPATAGMLEVAYRRRFPVAVAVGLAGVAAHAIRGLWRPVHGLPFGWWLLLDVAVYAALIGWGELSQARRAVIASLRERARRAEAEQARRVAEARALERTRIAREMHDVLAHRLSLLATYAGALEYRPDAPPEQLSRAAAVIRAGTHDALSELREVIAVLRDDDPDVTGPADDDRAPGDSEHPQPVLADLPGLVAESRAAGTPVDVDNHVIDPAALPAATGRAAYRIVQEALTNARKHAAGQPVRIVLSGGPGARLTIEICNPLPSPMAPGPTVPGTGTGLIGLTERVRLLGGQLDQPPAEDQFRLHAWLPWPA